MSFADIEARPITRVAARVFFSIGSARALYALAHAEMPGMIGELEGHRHAIVAGHYHVGGHCRQRPGYKDEDQHEAEEICPCNTHEANMVWRRHSGKM
ncbi:MAG: hypothetical protein K8H74_04130 [Notoacmeibacter sp.]|nr:hypothetical protein [Notoacmeibacter sp.]